MIGKNPLFVSRQHGHSVTTMWRTYAAWMEGALESDIALIQAAMNRDGRAIEQVSNPKIELTLNAPAVAGFGTRLATRREAPELKCLIKKIKRSGGEGGIQTQMQSRALRLKVMHGHRVANLERGEIFANLQRAVIGLTCLGDEIV